MTKTVGTFNFIFIGRSVSRKGTQSELLKKVLETRYGDGSVFYFATGDCFRNLTTQPALYTGKLVAEKVLKSGNKAHDALTIWCWAKEFVNRVHPEQHMILDGTPRTVLEAKAIDELMVFYDREKVFPIWLDVSYEWAYERLIGRGRGDDSPETIKNRLAYYTKYVELTVKDYQEESSNKLIRINGEQTIEKIHQDIVSAFGLR